MNEERGNLVEDAFLDEGFYVMNLKTMVSSYSQLFSIRKYNTQIRLIPLDHNFSKKLMAVAWELLKIIPNTSCLLWRKRKLQ